MRGVSQNKAKHTMFIFYGVYISIHLNTRMFGQSIESHRLRHFNILARYRPRCSTWWRYEMETFSVLLALSAGNSPVTGGFPLQRPVTWSFDDYFDLRLNKRLCKQSRRRWFETPSGSLWRHCNVYSISKELRTRSLLCYVFCGLWHVNFTRIRQGYITCGNHMMAHVSVKKIPIWHDEQVKYINWLMTWSKQN